MVREFNNTVKIDVRDDPNRLVTRLEIYKAFVDKTSDPEIGEHIDYISHFEKAHIWFITFKASYDVNLLLNQRIKVNNKDYLIQDADDPHVYCTYRLEWLPQYTSFIQVSNFLKHACPYLDLCHWGEEVCESKEIQTIRTGVHVIRGRILKDDLDKVKFKTGIYDFHLGPLDCFAVRYSCKIRVTLIMDKPKCFSCGSETHVRALCPGLQKKRGLSSKKLNYATMFTCPVDSKLCSVKEDDVEYFTVNFPGKKGIQEEEEGKKEKKCPGISVPIRDRSVQKRLGISLPIVNRSEKKCPGILLPVVDRNLKPLDHKTNEFDRWSDLESQTIRIRLHLLSKKISE